MASVSLACQPGCPCDVPGKALGLLVPDVLGPRSPLFAPFPDLSPVFLVHSHLGCNESALCTQGLFPAALPLSSGLFLNQVCTSLWQVGGRPGHTWHLVLMTGDAIWARDSQASLRCCLKWRFPSRFSQLCLLMREGSSRSPRRKHLTVISDILLPSRMIGVFVKGTH